MADLIEGFCIMDFPLVVINCLTYNHEPYIRHTLEGFVMQKTDFPFVAIVHDDASTDGTADIIREYAEKYPDIIKPILETENQYSKRDGSLRRIMDEACKATGAKYIAFCEGDDYWIDPLKLQKQADIMEKDPSISLVYSGFHTVDVNNQIIEDQEYEWFQQQSYSGNLLRQLIDFNFVLTVSTMYRATVYFSEFVKEAPASMDYLYTIASALEGNACYIPEKMVCYRRTPTGLVLSNWKHVTQTADRIKYYTIFGYKKHLKVKLPIKDHIQIQLRIIRQLTNDIYNKQNIDKVKQALRRRPQYLLCLPISFGWTYFRILTSKLVKAVRFDYI